MVLPQPMSCTSRHIVDGTWKVNVHTASPGPLRSVCVTVLLGVIWPLLEIVLNVTASGFAFATLNPLTVALVALVVQLSETVPLGSTYHVPPTLIAPPPLGVPKPLVLVHPDPEPV